MIRFLILSYLGGVGQGEDSTCYLQNHGPKAIQGQDGATPGSLVANVQNTDKAKVDELEGWISCPECSCTLGPEIPLSPQTFFIFQQCADECGQFPGFELRSLEPLCFCCDSVEDDGGNPEDFRTLVYKADVTDLPEPPADYETKCEECRCQSGGQSFPTDANLDLPYADCLDHCEGEAFSYNRNFKECQCCTGSNTEDFPGVPSLVYVQTPENEENAEITGDPHIRTLDGQHYTLLNQGTFSLWKLRGIRAHFASQSLDVDWEVYARYTGHLSYTKGLLLVDKSGGAMRQSLEITSKDCQWMAKTNGSKNTQNPWSKVENIQMVSVPEGQAFATGFKINPSKKQNHVSFMMNDDGMKEIAVLSVSCRPGHNINMAIKMKRTSDVALVAGEVRVGRHTSKMPSMMQMDDEFAVKTGWENLGGSGTAAQYFQIVEDKGGSSFLECMDAEKVEAEKLCSKHLGDMQTTDVDFFNDCIFDACRGGEVAAELAAELRAVTRAISG